MIFYKLRDHPGTKAAYKLKFHFVYQKGVIKLT